MLTKYSLEQSTQLSSDEYPLTTMTAFFLERLCHDQGNIRQNAAWNNLRRSASQIVRLVALHELNADNAKALQHDELSSAVDYSSAHDYRSIRTFISGMSHHFSNLLMGIWGHTSLIRLSLDAHNPVYANTNQMESLIQNGAFLIHLVLGYLGERRLSAKRIRLNQLLQEIKMHCLRGSFFSDAWNFKERLQLAAQVQRPRLIASSTARVMERLLKEIQIHCSHIAKKCVNSRDIQKKLSKIDNLAGKGLSITYQLLLYAGDIKPQLKPVKLTHIAAYQARLIRKKYAHIKVICRVRYLDNSVQADRHQIRRVLRQVLDNAIKAMPNKGGTLTIDVRSLQQESPRERLVLHGGSDYMVITVKDNGQGMDTNIQSRIFDPFFSNSRFHRNKGLGLAAVNGIVRSHGGYIQVKSSKGQGTLFKIYLPIDHSIMNQVDRSGFKTPSQAQFSRLRRD